MSEEIFENSEAEEAAALAFEANIKKHPQPFTQVVHTDCGVVSNIDPSIIPTLQRQPDLIKNLKCRACNDYFGLRRFIWVDNGLPIYQLANGANTSSIAALETSEQPPEYHIQFVFRGGGGKEEEIVKSGEIAQHVEEIVRKHGDSLTAILVSKFER